MAKVTFDVDDADIKRVKKNLDRVSGKSLYVKMQRATLTAGDLVKRRIQSQSPRQTGRLRKSIRTRPLRNRFTGRATASVLVGPTAPHRHLVILGTRVRPAISGRSSNPWRVLPGTAGQTFRGRALLGVNVRRASTIGNTGRMTPNPFVDRASRGFGRKAAELVRQEWFR